MTSPPSPRQQWDERYGAEHYLFGTEPNGFLRDHVDALPDGDVLCLADGEGRNSVYLGSTGRRVSSVDLSEAGVAKTVRLAAECGVSVDAAVGDLGRFDLGNERWDGIVSIFAHLPAAVRVDLHRRVVIALRPGGVLLLESYTPDQVGRGTGGPPVPELTMTAAGLGDELHGLEFLHCVEVEREVVEGVGHTGTGSVVQLIARKPA